MSEEKLPNPGFHFNPKDKDVFISNETVERILDFAERSLALVLEWSANNPVQFTLLLAFLAYLAYLRKAGKSERKKMEIEYNKYRDENKIPELPLPPQEPIYLPKPSGENKKGDQQ